MTEMGGAISALNTFWDITLVTALNGGELWGLHHLYIGVLKWTQNNFLRKFPSLWQAALLPISEASAPGSYQALQFSQEHVNSQVGLYWAVGIEELPSCHLLESKSFPLLFGSEGKVFRGGPDVVPSLASSWVSSPSLDFEGVDCVVFESVGSGTKLPGFIPSSVIYQLHGLGQVPWPC